MRMLVTLITCIGKRQLPDGMSVGIFLSSSQCIDKRLKIVIAVGDTVISDVVSVTNA